MLRIREIRLEKGLSVPRLSELSGVSRRTIQDLEKRGDCMLSTAAKLAAAMDVRLNDVWEDEPGKEMKMKLENIRNAGFGELKNAFEGKHLTDEQLDALAENEGVWYEKAEYNGIDHGYYECRDMTAPAGEKPETFQFYYEL